MEPSCGDESGDEMTQKFIQISAAESHAFFNSLMTEAELGENLLDAVHKLGGFAVHFRPGQTNRTYTDKKGEEHQLWVTPVQGDGIGYPDWTIFLPHQSRHLWVELKKEREERTLEQIEYASRIEESGGEYYCWHPHDWQDGTIERILRGEK